MNVVGESGGVLKSTPPYLLLVDLERLPEHGHVCLRAISERETPVGISLNKLLKTEDFICIRKSIPRAAIFLKTFRVLARLDHSI